MMRSVQQIFRIAEYTIVGCCNTYAGTSGALLGSTILGAATFWASLSKGDFSPATVLLEVMIEEVNLT